MAPKLILNLKGFISPLGLLKCKALLNTMEAGDLLEVILGDQDVADCLTTIVQRSCDELYFLEKRPKGICLCIRKGKKD